MLQVLTSRPEAVAIHCGRGLIVLWLQNLHILGDGDGRFQVVPCNHHHANASATCCQHGILDSIAVWIDGGDEAQQSQVLSQGRKLLIRGDLVVVSIEGKFLHGSYSHRQDTQGLHTVFIDDLQDLCFGRICHLRHASIWHHSFLAQVHNEVGCTLTNRHVFGACRQRHAVLAEVAAATDVRDGEHHLSRRREWNLDDARVLFRHFLAVSHLPGGHHDRCL
mmetsp:Transcript_30335/g.65437  ORF Transcript_30335/g.65437 Transcript_30335/m.65437 type:complete len:221 (+) Transcript_30335:1206-1868(+)